MHFKVNFKLPFDALDAPKREMVVVNAKDHQSAERAVRKTYPNMEQVSVTLVRDRLLSI